MLQIIRSEIWEKEYKQKNKQNPQRNINEEDPMPRQSIRYISTQRGPNDRCEAEHPAHETLILTSLSWREKVTNDRKSVSHHDSRPYTLNPAENYDLRDGFT